MLQLTNRAKMGANNTSSNQSILGEQEKVVEMLPGHITSTRRTPTRTRQSSTVSYPPIFSKVQ
jgi:hypothetical protein